MKAAEIEVGREYAVGRRKTSVPERVVVLEVGNIPRQVRASAKSWRTVTKVLPGVRFRKLNRETGEAFTKPAGYIGDWSDEETFPLSKVLCTWEEYLSAKAESERFRQKQAERREALREKASELGIALKEAGVGGYVTDSGASIIVSLDADAADRLLALLRS